MTPEPDPIALLESADPELADQIRASLYAGGPEISRDRLEVLADDTLEALGVEISYGRAVGVGLAALAAKTPEPLWERYRSLVKQVGGRRPTRGRHLAEALVPVIQTENEALLDRFVRTADILARKGTYTFPRTFEALTRLLAGGDVESAALFLDLLAAVFSGEISYNRSQRLTVVLPRAVLSFSPVRRPWQVRLLTRVARTDQRLIEPFLEGIEKGLDLLSEPALARFTAEGIARYREQQNRGRRFFALESKIGADTCKELQVTVSLAQVRERLNRYLRARTESPLSVLPLSALSKSRWSGGLEEIAFFSGRRTIYLPETLRIFSRRSENVGLYKALARLEGCFHEFGTHDFDLEKAQERIGEPPGPFFPDAQKKSDLERFCSRFDEPSLAHDLYFIFEHGRIRRCVAAEYPGLLRTVYPLLQEAFDGRRKERAPHLCALFEALVFDRPPGGGTRETTVRQWVESFRKETAAAPVPETAAVLTDRFYPEAAASSVGTKDPGRPYRPFAFPFGHRLRPDLVFEGERQARLTADRIKEAVEKSGRLRVYRSDLVRALANRREPLGREALEAIVVPAGPEHETDAGIDLADIDLSRWLAPSQDIEAGAEDAAGPVYWYPEWDSRMDDYLQRHVRVREREIAGDAGEFYRRVLNRRRHLVGRIRYAFELLRPEGIKILRQWVEGDAFDHRALIDFAVDRKAGRTPTDRLYIKRLKQERDIGVLLLVDLSRSTANRVPGSTASVLDVEKEALVLFCEALGTVGDTFAVAGFSGTGRLGVDYVTIKEFEQDDDDAVRGRIGALSPRRSTRMGAAIRHATAKMEALESRVKLLLVLGDGFPNDADYKQDYAIADTRKAISEARAKRIQVRAITVNLPADPKLDALYGKVHHNVITDVRELPDRLLRIYSSLTRC